MAPDEIDVVRQVIADHPEIDRSDDTSLDKGRAAITDWVAQRLNKKYGKVVWGRKSRGVPKDGKADRPNTDGLTYLRPDNLFEIYDIISGGGDKGAMWGKPTHALKAGENGYWCPPQLGPEP